MKLQTQIPLHKAKNQIDYNSKVLLLGSCFAENIGAKFEYYKFQSVVNPLGILFHPLGIEKLIEYAVLEKQFQETDVFFQNDLWHCFDSHSSLSALTKEELLQNLNSAIANTKKQILNAIHIVITLGTSWVYRHLETKQIVANCHKVPQKEFQKELLSPIEIELSFKRILGLIASVNTTANVVFTISPVRHIKDGFVENQQSKSHLITALHSVLNSLTVDERESKTYFGSYEIMMDELRDYRYYATDMVHPNQLAIDYIWEKFASVWITEKAVATMKKVVVVQSGLSHKPFNSSSPEHQKFKKTLHQKITYLQDEFPFMKF